MIRKNLLIVTLISFCSVAHANVVKDTSRVVAGTAIGAAGMAAAQSVYNAGKMIIWDGTWDSQKFPGLDYQMIRVSAAVGGAIGLLKTTHLRTLRAQLFVWWSRSQRELIGISMNQCGSEAELVAALEHYCTGHTYPLVAAKQQLSFILSDVNTAARLIEDVLEDIAQESSRAKELNDWLDELYTIRAHVAYAINAIDKDPRILTLVDAQNRIDQTNALWADAIAHAAVAASNSRSN